MNQFFNIKRFTRLAAYDVRINYKKYLIALAIGFVGICLLSYYFYTTRTFSSILFFDENRQPYKSIEEGLVGKNFQVTMYQFHTIFNLILIFIYSIFVGMSFSALSGKKSAMNYLMLPASVFEKYLYEFFIRIIIGYILFLLIFYCAANISLGVYELHLNTKYADIVEKYQSHIQVGAFSYKNLIMNEFFNRTPDHIRSVIIVTIVFTSIYLCGFALILFFKRFAFFKTVVSVTSAVLLATIGVITLGRVLDNKGISLSWFRYDWWLLSLSISATIFFLFSGYYKLKKRRV